MTRVVVDLPLLNIWLPEKWNRKVFLSDNEYIRKVESDEIQLQRGPPSLFVLEVLRNGEDPAEIGNQIIDFAGFFIKVLTLYKSGRIGYGNPVYVEPKIQTYDDREKNYQLTIIDSISTRSIGIWNPNYRLLENEVEDLISFNSKMESLDLDESNQLDYSIIVSLERLARTSKSIELASLRKTENIAVLSHKTEQGTTHL